MSLAYTPTFLRYFKPTGEESSRLPINLVEPARNPSSSNESQTFPTPTDLSALQLLRLSVQAGTEAVGVGLSDVMTKFSPQGGPSATPPAFPPPPTPTLNARKLLRSDSFLTVYEGDWKVEPVIIKLATASSLERHLLLRTEALFYQRKEGLLKGLDIIPELVAVFEFGKEEDGERPILVFKPYGERVEIEDLGENDRKILLEKLKQIHLNAHTLLNYWADHIYRSEDGILRIADFGCSQTKHNCDGDCFEMRRAPVELGLMPDPDLSSEEEEEGAEEEEKDEGEGAQKRG
ncbi:hypothetical protein JCM6882_006928 [Rhodosporidiobolus microsporus]